MTQRLLRRLVLLTAIAAAWPVVVPISSYAQGRGAAADPVEKAIQLKPDLYYVPGGGANSVIRVTPEGLILIDTKNPGAEIAAALIEQIKSVSSLPVKYVLNTHHHPDHTGNNQAFVAMGAAVIGLEKMKQ